MSSLTSLGINKNKKAFAPKVGKRNVRKPGSSKEKAAEKKTTDRVKKETVAEAAPVIEDNVRMEEQIQTVEEPTFTTPDRVPAEPMNTDLELNELGLTQEEMQMNVLATTAERQSFSPFSAPSPVANVDEEGSDCALRGTRSSVKSERITPGAHSLRKSMSRALKEDEGERIDAKDILAAAPMSSTPASPVNFETWTPTPSRTPSPPPSTKKTRSKKAKGKGKAVEGSISTSKASSATKRSARTTKASTSGGSSIGIGIPSSSGATPISIGAPTATDTDVKEEESAKKTGVRRKGPKKFAYRLPENLKTLDDITNDPAKPDNLEKPMCAFTKDIDGIVSKNFKEMETVRYTEKRKLEEAASLSPEELEAAKKKEEEEAELNAKRRKIAQEKEAERRKKEMDGTILAESANSLQVRLVNGQIVLDTDSLTVERTQNEIDYGDGALEVVEENSMTKKVNSQTYGKRQRSIRWDAVETELFYDCIAQFGTDFEMISMVMPGRTRAQIRSKFNREEKVAPEKITEYLIKKKKPLDLTKYEELAGIALDDVPEDFHEMQLA
ncbi:hypothetical protein INT47_008729 [Mucor saturninus]|uniref:Myb-like domain-containing protein n=1 Tax=Mucor saturninus TaxID=64648 RepID=A0A8H7RJY4_9FUNG|nr:hypothetical protein INT47_008729 [Mucor saturninus]